LKYYRDKGVTVSLVTKENWFVQLPDDLFAYASVVPCVDGDKSNDDYFVLKLAYDKNCSYVTNDNLRDWPGNLSKEMTTWLRVTEKQLRITYMFTNDGDFVPRKEIQKFTKRIPTPQQLSEVLSSKR